MLPRTLRFPAGSCGNSSNLEQHHRETTPGFCSIDHSTSPLPFSPGSLRARASDTNCQNELCHTPGAFDAHPAQGWSSGCSGFVGVVLTSSQVASPKVRDCDRDMDIGGAIEGIEAVGAVGGLWETMTGASDKYRKPTTQRWTRRAGMDRVKGYGYGLEYLADKGIFTGHWCCSRCRQDAARCQLLREAPPGGGS